MMQMQPDSILWTLKKTEMTLTVYVLLQTLHISLKKLRTFKCFTSDERLSILLFKILLPRAEHLTEIGLRMRFFDRNRKL